MVYGRRLWLAVRESTLAKRARWRCEGVVTSAMCPASFLAPFSERACGEVRSEYMLSASVCTIARRWRDSRAANCGRRVTWTSGVERVGLSFAPLPSDEPASTARFECVCVSPPLLWRHPSADGACSAGGRRG